MRLTLELQPAELEGDEPVADLDQVHEGVEVVRGQNEAVAGAVVAPTAQREVPAQGGLEGPGHVLVEDGVAAPALAPWDRGETRSGGRGRLPGVRPRPRGPRLTEASTGPVRSLAHLGGPRETRLPFPPTLFLGNLVGTNGSSYRLNAENLRTRVSG